MKKSILLSISIILSLTFVSFSQTAKREKDRESIKKMCGCFEVEFKFSETFNYSEDSLYVPSENKIAHALEYAQLVQEKDDLIMIQHLLIVGDESNPHIVKHWRQDWLFENKDFYSYDGDNKWDFLKKNESDVAGNWTQKVYQVDDSPRYEGNGSWVYVDGKTYWESETNAPLPRREYTKRSDYNITLRRNKHIIRDEGWVHDQNNDKILREKRKKDFVIAEEKGINTYKRVPDERCEGAIKWWQENQNFWSLEQLHHRHISRFSCIYKSIVPQVI
ncbi:MAG: hypothetical protein P8L20_10785 [Flavobacteriales bacterium]|nr:hypothetical protein [Flavobacteriales bacterium]